MWIIFKFLCHFNSHKQWMKFSDFYILHWHLALPAPHQSLTSIPQGGEKKVSPKLAERNNKVIYKQLNKVRGEIYKIETVKTNKNDHWNWVFWKRINKIDKTLARLVQNKQNDSNI